MLNNIVMNGLAGESVNRLLLNGLDPSILRLYREPYTRADLDKAAKESPAQYAEMLRINQSGQSFYDAFNGVSYTPTPVWNTATLRKDDWITIDGVVTKIARARLSIVNRLRALGLVRPLAGGMATTVLQSQNVSDMRDARMAMSPQFRSENDRVEYDLTNLPLPITFSNFEIDLRVLMASQRSGTPLDTTQVTIAMLKAAEKIETVFAGTADTFTYGGGTVYGLINYPDANDVTIEDWTDLSNTTADDIIKDVLEMIEALKTDHYYGPYGLFVPPDFQRRLDEDYNSTSGITIRERILKIPSISFVEESDYFTKSNVVLAQMTEDVITGVEAMPLAPVEWDGAGGFLKYFMILGIIVPHIRSDQAGRCGIALGQPSGG